MENAQNYDQANDFQKKLSYKFPGLVPIKSAPSLGTLNSVGVSIYGKYDYDSETNTYRKNSAICILFIPIFFLASYRVADAPNGGWYFLGKEKLGKMAKNWNIILLLLITSGIGLVAYNEHISSPEYIMRQKLKEADATYQSGKIESALNKYLGIIDGGYGDATQTIAKVKNIYEKDLLKLDASSVVKAWQEAGNRTKTGKSFPAKSDIIKYSNQYFEHFQSNNVKTADIILDVLVAVIPDDPNFKKKSQSFKVACFDKEPSHLPFAIAKAKELEAASEFDKCESVLAPLKKELKTTEGAKILGSIYFQKGLYSQSYEVLKPYFDSGLNKFHAAESQYKSTYKQVSEQASNALNSGQAGAAWESRYEKASKEEQLNMVDDYIYNYISKSPSFIKAREKINECSEIIDVAIQLGIALLNIANQSEPEEKTKRLLEAEKIFISVQGTASNSDDYILTYGEILFWLNRPKEGEIQFNNYLTKYKNDAMSLNIIADKYKSIGNLAKARELFEKGYSVAKNKEEKEEIAGGRAAIPTDLDDRIQWIEKCNQGNFYTKASLLSCKGQKKLNEGDNKEAEKFYKEALEVYEKIPDDATKLNNMSLTVSQLFEISYNTDYLKKSAELLKKSRDLDPKSTTILVNYANAVYKLLTLEEIPKEINIKKILGNFALDQAYFNISTQADKDLDNKRLIENPNFSKCIHQYEQLAVLAPQDKNSHFMLYHLLSISEDLEQIKKLQKNISSIEFNFSDYKKNCQDFYSNKDKEKYLELVNNGIKQFENIKIDLLNPNDPSDIILNCDYNEYFISKDVYGNISPDFSKIISFLEQSYKIKQREYVLKQIRQFSLYQGLNDIYISNESYKKEVDKFKSFKYSISHFAYYMRKHPEQKSLFLENKNIARALECITQQLNNFPKSLNISGAMLLISFDMDKENKIRNQFLKNIFLGPDIEINNILYPLSYDNILEKYFYLILLGNTKAANELIETSIKEGVPL